MRLLFLFFFSLGVISAQANPFIGTWQFDKTLTLQEAKEGKFKGHDVSKIMMQTDYIDHASNDGLIWFSIVTYGDGKKDTNHFTLYPENQVSEEYTRSKGKKVIDRVRGRKVDDYSFEISGVRDPSEPKKSNDWKGKIWVSKDKKYLRIKVDGIPEADYLYFKVFKRVE